jgi:hypothetical protein
LVHLGRRYSGEASDDRTVALILKGQDAVAAFSLRESSSRELELKSGRQALL